MEMSKLKVVSQWLIWISILKQVSLTNFPKFCNNCFLSLYYLSEASKKLSPRLLNINFLDVPVTINQVENWINSIGVKESAIILRHQEEMIGNNLLNNNLSQAYRESCPISDARRIIVASLANMTSQIEGIL
ncbi:hypothetical protein M1146_04200 [Patescibacteria group bacterium]|nr:hypothetical protein [Patescibacteria group bacterium]